MWMIWWRCDELMVWLEGKQDYRKSRICYHLFGAYFNQHSIPQLVYMAEYKNRIIFWYYSLWNESFFPNMFFDPKIIEKLLCWSLFSHVFFFYEFYYIFIFWYCLVLKKFIFLWKHNNLFTKSFNKLIII